MLDNEDAKSQTSEQKKESALTKVKGWFGGRTSSNASSQQE
jgi:hypothetical protein